MDGTKYTFLKTNVHEIILPILFNRHDSRLAIDTCYYVFPTLDYLEMLTKCANISTIFKGLSENQRSLFQKDKCLLMRNVESSVKNK